jgi:hypothetical protein
VALNHQISTDTIAIGYSARNARNKIAAPAQRRLQNLLAVAQGQFSNPRTYRGLEKLMAG